MHERSLVRALLKQVESIRQRHGAEQVTEVRVEVGPLAGVEPLLLGVAFEEMAVAGSVCGARIMIDEVALHAECEACSHNFEMTDFVFRCPHCGSNVRVTRGDEFRLVSVSVTSNEPHREVVS